jgi:hypothetical protein
MVPIAFIHEFMVLLAVTQNKEPMTLCAAFIEYPGVMPEPREGLLCDHCVDIHQALPQYFVGVGVVLALLVMLSTMHSVARIILELLELPTFAHWLLEGASSVVYQGASAMLLKKCAYICVYRYTYVNIINDTIP